MNRFSAVALGVVAVLTCAACGSQGGTVGAPAASRVGVTVESTSEATPGRPGWEEVPEGAAPVVPYVAGDAVVTPEGEWPVPRSTWGLSGVVAYAGGLLMSDERFFEGANGIHLVIDGRVDETWPGEAGCSSGAPVASDDGTRVAWVTVRCPESGSTATGAVHRAGVDGSDAVSEPVGAELVSVVGFAGDEVVFNAGADRGVSVTDFTGSAREVPGIRWAYDVDPATGRLVAARTGAGMGVVELDGGVQWTTPAPLRSFSPDGSRVLAVRGRRVALLDAVDGTEVAAFGLPAGAGAHDLEWETDSTLLGLVRRERRVAVVRLHPDGTVERVAALRRAGAAQRRPYVLLRP
jgi:hypothetical protein